MDSIIDQMPDDSRLWVYQSSRAFTAKEQEMIAESMKVFVDQWAAHGQQLAASCSILHDQFIVLAVDESQAAASGCSIDASVAIIRQIEGALNISLLDRSQVAFLKDGQVRLAPFNQVKQAISSGDIQEDTIIFNNAVSSAKDWKTNWKIPAHKSWMARHFA